MFDATRFHSEICAALCISVVVRDVPIGFSIATPVPWFNGDCLSFYARVDGDRIRFEDSGDLLGTIEAMGADISIAGNADWIAELLASHAVTLDKKTSTFCTGWAPADSAGNMALAFLVFLARLQDMLRNVPEGGEYA